jgi:PAS domain S-box-containing protein
MLTAYEQVIVNSSNMSKTDVNGIITFANEEFCQTTGYTQEELLGKSHAILNHPDNDDEKFQKLWQTITSKKIYNGIIKNLTKDNKTIYLKTTIYPILDDEENIIEYISTRVDVTKEIELEVENEKQNILMKETQNRLKQAQEIANLGSWRLNFQTNDIEWSEQVYQMFEINKSMRRISYDDFLEMIHHEDRQMVKETFEASIKKHQPYNISHRLLMKDGRVKWVEEQGQTVYDKNKKPLECMGVIRDVTEKYEKEQKIQEQEKLLFQQNKMAVMGEMLEIIAHQWRQPLSVMSTVSSGMKLKQQMNLLTKEKVFEYTDSISESVQYLSQTIDDFRNYFKSNNSNIVFSLEETFTKVLKLLHLRKGVQVYKNIESFELYTNENELVQIFMNIINNSRDEFERKSQKKKLLFIESVKKQNRVIIKIRDNAGGIPQEILERIFEPYFTTKENEGTGLGLYMCKELMVKHLKGDIDVHNVAYEHKGKSYIGAEFVLQWEV